MAELLILWGYIGIVNSCIGAGVLKGIGLLTGRKKIVYGLAGTELAGIVAITVYAQTVSIFGKVFMAAHLILLAAAAACAYWCRKELLVIWSRVKKICLSWEGVLYLIFAVMTAYFASRGLQHTDTGIYHAQAIRWYEEYGLVKGLGNLQQHFAYNSAYLAYAAAFSMKWLVGQSLHGTNGFLQAFLCIWALYGLKNFARHKSHLADGCRVGILLYAIVVSERIMSPATDFGTMYLVFFIVTLWTSIACEKEGKVGEKTDLYALLCVAVVCVTTFKLSAGMLVILALYPAVCLIRSKEWKNMNRYSESQTKSAYRSPVYNVRAVPVEKVVANSYNPNVVAPPEMKLLELSIWEDGYTMPCVCYYDAERDRYELVDGYHRYLVLKTSKRIYERERGLLPVAVIEKDLSNRMASTIRHNRARGTHNVELMSEIVAELTRANMSDQWIMRHIGMDRDELLRLKQITGLADLFADKEFSLGDTDEDSVEEMLEV